MKPFNWFWVIFLILLGIATCSLSEETKDTEEPESWYDEIKDKAKESSKQYARDALRYAVQTAMQSTLGGQGDYEPKRSDRDDDIYINQEGKTMGQILDAKLTAEEKDKEQERKVHTYFIVFISAFVIFLASCIIVLVRCIYMRYSIYITMLNSVIWFVWAIVVLVKYYKEYSKLTNDDDDD